MTDYTPDDALTDVSTRAQAAIDRAGAVVEDMAATARQSLAPITLGFGISTAAVRAAAESQLSALRMRRDVDTSPYPPGFDTLLGLHMGEPDENGDYRFTVTYTDGARFTYSTSLRVERDAVRLAANNVEAARLLDSRARNTLTAPPQAELVWSLSHPQRTPTSDDRVHPHAMAYARARATGKTADMIAVWGQIFGDAFGAQLAEAMRVASDMAATTLTALEALADTLPTDPDTADTTPADIAGGDQ